MTGSVVWPWKSMCRGRGRPGRWAGMREREREGLSHGPGPDPTPSLGSWEVAEQIWWAWAVATEGGGGRE